MKLRGTARSDSQASARSARGTETSSAGSAEDGEGPHGDESNRPGEWLAALSPRQIATTSFRKAGILVGWLVLLGIFTSLSPGFLSAGTLVNIAQQSSITALVGIGITIVIIGRGIDLSVGSMMALCAVVFADVMAMGVPVPAALIIVAAVGVAAGSLNALIIHWLNVPAFVVTLGGLSFYRGLALLYAGGQPIYGTPPAFSSVFRGELWTVPTPVWMTLAIAALAHVMLWHTRFGRHVRAVGGDETAARVSGVHVARVRSATYLVGGFCTAAAAVVLVARLGAAEPVAGEALELSAIATAVIGGASLAGGRGSIVGTVLGALIIGTLQTGLTVMGVPAFYQLIAIGALIVLAVAVDPKRKERE